MKRIYEKCDVDYCIYEADENAEQVIEKLRFYKNGEKLGSPGHCINKKDFISRLAKKDKIMTMYKENGTWHEGAEVEVIGNYLRTDQNKTKKDNLGTLPKANC